MTLSLLTPSGYNVSTCGYCSPLGQRSERRGSCSYGIFTKQMSPQFYQDMIDRGWRRSGGYTYHPDMARTCCPQYTIRLDVAQFKTTRQQRSAVNRWNRFLETSLKPGEGGGDDAMVGTDKKGKGKAKAFDLMTEIRAHQVGYGEGKRRFQLEFTPAKVTTETYKLYQRYQMSVHGDSASKASKIGFQRFLCDSPLGEQDIEYTSGTDTTHLPKTYGSYHLLYRVDGKLVGISVIDILPACVSSVYFIWDPDWAWAGLGKLSALYEIALAKDMALAGAQGMKWLYMGFWIATCQKMRYKGEYSPSYLLDPGTNEWHALTPKMDKYLQARKSGYTPFTEIEAWDGDIDSVKAGETALRDDMQDPDDSDEEAEWPTPPPPSFLDPTTLDQDYVDNLVILLMDGGEPSLIPYKIWRRVTFGWVQKSINEIAAALGPEMMASFERKTFRTKGIISFGA